MGWVEALAGSWRPMGQTAIPYLPLREEMQMSLLPEQFGR